MELREDRILEELEEQPKRKTIFFLDERVVEPVNTVIFENGIFFVERISECLVIRSKTVKQYLKHVRGTKRTVKFERKIKDILIPLSQTRENSMLWFEKKYVLNGKRNQQGRFIQEVWKHRNNVFSEVMMG